MNTDDTITTPTDYTKLTYQERREVREQYIKQQHDKCFYCGKSLNEFSPPEIVEKPIDWRYFPPNFLEYPVHLQHNHSTGMTEGAVHSYCNAVMWQYEGK